MKRTIFFVLLFVSQTAAFGQQEDDSLVFKFEDLLGFVRAYHPVVVQTKLRLENAEWTITQQRGALDPKLYSDFNNKEFDGKNYYNKWKSGLKIPTWFGADFKVGYEQNSGEFLNPENNIPIDGQFEVGVSVPILQNLVYNDRRVAIQQAQLIQQGTEAEQRAIVNNLIYEVSSVYWFWVESYAVLQIYKESVATAQQRFEAVKRNYINGYKPAIDTLESLIQLQNRMISTQEAEVAFANASLMLSNYLWYEDQTPLELQPGMRPPLPQSATMPVVSNDSLTRFKTNATGYHPEVAQINVALSSMEIQRKMYANNMLPELLVDYSLLSGNASSWENATDGMAWNNYKLGVSFVMPLFLRKERSYLNSVRIKTDETTLKLDLKQREIANKVDASYNKFTNLSSQIVLYKQTVSNYEQLYQAETRRFGMGESTLFLVNSRELKTLEAKLKLVQMLSKYQIYYQGIWWSGGALR
jgi:outer membrane protein TolC